MIRRSLSLFVCLAATAAAGCSGGGGSPSGDRLDRDILIKNLGGPTSEAGGLSTFQVVLRSRPSSDVVLDLSSDDTGEGTVSPESLTFTGLNWNAPQTVTVTGQNDLLDDGNVVFHVVFGTPQTNDDKYAAIELEPIPITNLDDETAGIHVGPPSGATTEAGGSATISVRLMAAPSADVTIPVASEDLTEADLAADSLVFTTLNWSTAQTIAVSGVDDALADGNLEYGVTIDPAVSADPAYDGLAPAVSSFTLLNIDNDTPGVVTAGADTVTSESAGTGEFSVQLTSQPAEDVVVAFAVDVATEAVVSSSSLTFTSTDWFTPQTVTVTGLDDLLADGHQPFQVVFMPASSNDGAFDGLATAPIDFVNLDDEAGGITVAPLVGVTTETGSTFELTVVLDGEPADDVMISLETSDPSEGTASPASLTFTAMNWDEPQTVTVTGASDGKRDGNRRYWVNFAPAVTNDPVYDGLKAQRVNMTNVDDADLSNIVIFDDGLPTHATFAVDTSGAYTAVSVFDSPSFEAALAQAAATIVELSSLTLSSSAEAALAAFVTSGGSAIIAYHDLDGAPALQAALGVTASAPHTTYRNVFRAPGTAPDLFRYEQTLATVITGTDQVADNGHELMLTGDGTLPGRLDTASGAGAIAVTNEGRVIVHGFAPDDADATDVDGDTRPDVLELYENEIAFLTRAPPPLRVDVDVPLEILDDGTVESAVVVSGLLEAVSAVRLSMHATHTYVSDLDIVLIAPDGTEIDVASDVGSSGDDLGLSCEDVERTVWDDTASSTIPTSSGAAPWVGSWRPEQAFVNLQGIDGNGTWILSITDDASGDDGFVECWSLFLEY